MDYKKIVLAVSVAFLLNEVKAQDGNSKDIFDLSLEELMNTNIVSASKKSESLFDTPFSASVLTKEEMNKAGVNSIMEAFRLMPGLIVREQTNGNFDVHIRGLDNVPPNGLFVNAASTTALVMIDNRPVYNYLQGGTFWESLPIDLNDVDKIEIVRGASSAMYGPNAVSGVINIITRKPTEGGPSVIANTTLGTNATSIANASVGYQVSPKFNFMVSGNYHKRDRHEVSYYRAQENDFVKSPDLLEVSNPDERYPDPEMSMRKYGANAFLHYAPTDKIKLDLTTGLQDSEVQKVYGDNLITPISFAKTTTKYADLKADAFGFSGQVSVLGGPQDPTVGFTGSKYDFTTLDAFLEYHIQLKKLSIKPGYNYRKATYDDLSYWDASRMEGTISGRKEIITNAIYVRADYQATDKLRFFGGTRLDKFNHPDKTYFSYQFASTYSVNDKNLVRFALSRANRSPFIYDTYLNLAIDRTQPVPFPPFSYPASIQVHGNKNLELVVSDVIEIGYRSKLAKNLQIDLDIFGSNTKNYSELILDQTDLSGLATGAPIVINVEARNLPMVVQQVGTTLSVNYIVHSIQIKPFVTFQQTHLRNYSSYYNSELASPSEANPNPEENNYRNGTDTKHQATPAAFGGAFINYQVNRKFNINLNPYFYAANTFKHRDAVTYNDGLRGVEHLNSKLLVNARVSYKVLDQMTFFISGRNLLNDTSREFYRSEAIGSSYFAGINFEL